MTKHLRQKARIDILTPYPFRVVHTSDVLVIEIELTDGSYASANGQQRGAMRFSAKTPVYKRLAHTVETAGAIALADGWVPIDVLAEYRVVRVAPDARVRDALNLGQCESNSLARAGVWTDDYVAAPVVLDTQIDPAGPDRIHITVTRIHQRNDRHRNARPTQRKRSRGRAPAIAEAPSPDTRVALVNGKPVPYSDALDLIAKNS